MKPQRPNVVLALLALAAAGVLAGAGGTLAQVKHGEAAPSPPAAPTGEARAILAEAEGYRSWSKFPRYAREPALSKGHGGTYVVAWYNEAAAQGARGGRYPDGSILVKENRPKPDAAPVALTVMAKRGGAWYWIRATPDWEVFTRDGEPIAGTDVAGCAGCHTAAPDDMVFSR